MEPKFKVGDKVVFSSFFPDLKVINAEPDKNNNIVLTNFDSNNGINYYVISQNYLSIQEIFIAGGMKWKKESKTRQVLKGEYFLFDYRNNESIHYNYYKEKTGNKYIVIHKGEN